MSLELIRRDPSCDNGPSRVVPLQRQRIEALLITGLLLLLVLGDLATMLADRAKPVNRRDFAGEFYGSEGESVTLADPWPELAAS